MASQHFDDFFFEVFPWFKTNMLLLFAVVVLQSGIAGNIVCEVMHTHNSCSNRIKVQKRDNTFASFVCYAKGCECCEWMHLYVCTYIEKPFLLFLGKSCHLCPLKMCVQSY